MLNFLRQIRQKLLENGNLRKYFWYAVGEILLVMIGILLALQVNNWNETRKAEIAVNEALIEIRQNMVQDLSNIKAANSFNSIVISDLIRLTEDAEDIPDDSLNFYIDRLHRASAYNPITFGFDQLEQLTIPVTVPDSLIRTLTDYYTEFVGDGVNNIAFRDLSIYNINKYRDYMIEQGFPVSTFNNIEGANPSNLRKIISDMEFKGIARSTINSRNVQSLGFSGASEMIQQCINQIDAYLISQ